MEMARIKIFQEVALSTKVKDSCNAVWRELVPILINKLLQTQFPSLALEPATQARAPHDLS
jgi:hypothetical protein